MNIEKNRWYKVLIDGVEHIVQVNDRIMKYCVIDYYDGRLWFVGSSMKCKRWIMDRRIIRNG